MLMKSLGSMEKRLFSYHVRFWTLNHDIIGFEQKGCYFSQNIKLRNVFFCPNGLLFVVSDNFLCVNTDGVDINFCIKNGQMENYIT
jgi:hypothetical protein